MKKGDLLVVDATKYTPNFTAVWKWSENNSWIIAGHLQNKETVILLDRKNPVSPRTGKSFSGYVKCLTSVGVGFIHLDYLRSG